MTAPERTPADTTQSMLWRSRGVAVAAGGAAALALAALSAWLTRSTDLTFHIHPFLIAAAPGVVTARVAGERISRRSAAIAAAFGLLAVAIGWGALVAVGDGPTATFIQDQPGGIVGETAAMAGAGAAFGLRAALRAQRRGSSLRGDHRRPFVPPSRRT